MELETNMTKEKRMEHEESVRHNVLECTAELLNVLEQSEQVTGQPELPMDLLHAYWTLEVVHMIVGGTRPVGSPIRI
jgi:hypothetical protein